MSRKYRQITTATALALMLTAAAHFKKATGLALAHVRLAPSPQRDTKRDTALVSTLAIAVLAALVIVPAANGAVKAYTLRLDSTMFASQIGSTTTGGSVYAGAVVDPRLGHGAAVYSTPGATAVRGIFHEYFALGSINGTGRITVVTGATGGPATFTGPLKVIGGTGAYRQARGKLAATGTIHSTGVTMAAIRGAVSY